MTRPISFEFDRRVGPAPFRATQRSDYCPARAPEVEAKGREVTREREKGEKSEESERGGRALVNCPVVGALPPSEERPTADPAQLSDALRAFNR